MNIESLSQGDKNIVWAVERGYSYKDGGIVSFTGKKLKYGTTKKGYYTFSFRPSVSQILERKTFAIFVHRFIAYLKFGDKLFEPDMLVRHLNEVKTDNSWNNLELGTRSQNAMDMPPEKRMRLAINAASKNRVFSDLELEQMRKDRDNGLSYAEIARKWNLKNKGHAHNFINRIYKTNK